MHYQGNGFPSSTKVKERRYHPAGIVSKARGTAFPNCNNCQLHSFCTKPASKSENGVPIYSNCSLSCGSTSDFPSSSDQFPSRFRSLEGPLPQRGREPMPVRVPLLRKLRAPPRSPARVPPGHGSFREKSAVCEFRSAGPQGAGGSQGRPQGSRSVPRFPAAAVQLHQHLLDPLVTAVLQLSALLVQRRGQHSVVIAPAVFIA